MRSLPLCLTLGLIVSAVALAAPAPKKVTTATLVGTSLNDGPRVRLTWSSWVATPLSTVRKRMTDWSLASRLIEDFISFSLEREATDGRPARFAIKRASPVFFIPNPTIVFDATATDRKDGTVLITWKAVDGPPKSAERRWTLTSEAGGTRVTHLSEIELPFDPPDILFGDDPAKRLGDDVERFRQVVGAKQAFRSPPATTAKP